MENPIALYSPYIIDGVQQELTPGQMLDECVGKGTAPGKPGKAPISDESVDPSPQTGNYDNWKIQDYLRDICGKGERHFPTVFSAQYTKILVERSLIDLIWMDGHFRLGDIAVKAEWEWDFSRLGLPASFYASAQALSECLDDLGVRLNSYSLGEASECSLKTTASFHRRAQEDADILVEMPYHTRHPRFTYKRKQPCCLVDDPDSWIIFVPMDSCDFRLGGSLLAETLGFSGGTAPEPNDSDYFFDSYELVREMVEDGVIIAGETVGDGGLMGTLKKMSAASASPLGVRIQLTDLTKAYSESNLVRLLFAEVPGVVFQIRDEDYDYVDAEFVLQDVAFFPLGHPLHGRPEIKVDTCCRSGIQEILESIIRKQPTEGED